MKFLLGLLVLALVIVGPMGFASQQYILTQQLFTNATGTSTQILPQDNRRSYMLIQNLGAANVIVKIKTVQSASEGVVIPPGGNWEPQVVPFDPVFIKSASGTQAIVVIAGY